VKLFQITLFISVITCFSGVHAENWLVSNEINGDFSTISEALESHSVMSGDVVMVLPGIYEEAIMIPACRRITLRSTDGPQSTIIMPPVYKNNDKHMAVILKGRCTFEGFTVMENPINLSSTGNPGLLDMFGNGGPWPHISTGIYATGPGKIRHNIIIGFRVGVCSSCPSGAMGNPAIVRFNECHSNDIGVTICETTNVVRDNFIHDNYWLGVLISHGACGELNNNLIIHNGDLSRVASAGVLCWQDYVLRPEFNMTPIIGNNTIHSNRGPGIRLRYVRGGLCTPIIQHNILSWNEGPGILCETVFGDPDTMPYPIVHYCNFWNNTGGALHNISRVIGCMYVDPLYINGFYVDPDSPVINAGMLPGTWGTVINRDELDGKQVDLGYHHPPKSGQYDPFPLN